MCAVICRKATVALPDANPSLPEHKIGIFVLRWPPEPPFLGISSTKLGFLCFFGLRNPRFRVFRAQNQGFCALLAFGTPVFWHFEHKIEVFVLFWPSEPSFSGFSSTKSRFLCSFTKLDVGVGGLPRRKRHRRTCGAVAPAQPILPLTLPPLHLHSRRICVAAVPSAVACSRLPPVLPLLPPLHLLSRCTCEADTTAAYHRCT